MYHNIFLHYKETVVSLGFLIILGLAPIIGFGSCNGGFLRDSNVQTVTLTINSHSFNAKKKSNFKVGLVQEHVGRGLTIIHLRTSKDFEFKTFDTYSSKTATGEFVKMLGQLQKDKALYAILAHDSAAGALKGFTDQLGKMGFKELSKLQNRTAYIMHNLGGSLQEAIDPLSLTMTLGIPTTFPKGKEYFPRVKYTFEPSIDRYIAHAGGAVDGIPYTNTKEALDQNYKKGFRLFELDMIKTKDGKLVAVHDWKMWSRFTDYKGSLPVSLAEFKKHKIYGKYNTMDMEAINDWFAAHPDAMLFTDKVNDPLAFAEKFVDKNRLVMELFSLMAIEEATKAGIKAMISQEPLGKIKGDKLAYLSANNVKYVAMSRRIIANQTEFLLALAKKSIRVYVYNVNFDPGKDERYVEENELGLVYGMYADKWVFDAKSKNTSK